MRILPIDNIPELKLENLIHHQALRLINLTLIQVSYLAKKPRVFKKEAKLFSRDSWIITSLLMLQKLIKLRAI
jgi:hypothetical protein